MAITIQMKRGLFANLASAGVLAGEPKFVTDKGGQLYVGNGSANVCVSNAIERVTALPSSNIREDKMYFLSADAGDYVKGTYVWDGSAWVSCGITNYELLDNLPTINGVDVKGELTSEDLGLVPDTRKVAGFKLDADVALADLSNALADVTETLTNKTIDADDNTITDLAVSNFKSGVVATTVAVAASAVDTKVATEKAIRTAIDSAVSPKADKTYVDTQLALKANAAEVEAALALKADADDVDAALALKADTTYVDGQLALKADASDVYTKDETYNKEEVDGKVAGTYHYKGSVATISALPTTGQAEGDVYNVEQGGKINPDTDFETIIADGDNVAWVLADGAKVAHWDKLAGTVDLSNYYTKTQVDGLLDDKQDALSDAQMAAANSGITAEKRTGYDTHVANADIHVTAAQKTAWTAKQDALTDTQLLAVNSGITATKVGTYDGYAASIQANADAIDDINDSDVMTSGITATKVAKYDGYEETIEGKADAATTLAGYGITDAKIENGVITLGSQTITPLTEVPVASDTVLGGVKQGSNVTIDSAGVLSVPVDSALNTTSTAPVQNKVINAALGDKIDKVQGSENAGKLFAVGAGGSYTLIDTIDGGSF